MVVAKANLKNLTSKNEPKTRSAETNLKSPGRRLLEEFGSFPQVVKNVPACLSDIRRDSTVQGLCNVVHLNSVNW